MLACDVCYQEGDLVANGMQVSVELQLGSPATLARPDRGDNSR